jgi:hypothetical protein
MMVVMVKHVKWPNAKLTDDGERAKGVQIARAA